MSTDQFPDSAVQFVTDRLLIRRLSVADLEQMLIVYGDPEAVVWVDDGKPIPYEDAVRWIDITLNNYERRGYGMFVVEWRDTGEVAGFCGMVHPGGQQEVEIKYAFKRAYWGRGVATETVKGMVEYAQSRHGVRYLMATTAPQNLPSHAVLMKSGFRRGALLDNDDGTQTLVFEWQESKGEVND